MSDNELYLGIEIGGTKLQLAVGDARSTQLLRSVRLDVRREAGAAGIMAQIAAAAPPLIDEFTVRRIGIGFGGPVVSGRVLKSHQVSGWEDVPLADWCQQQFGLATTLGNDCDAAALAEATLGGGRGCRTVFYVTVGTGIGGGLVINGQLHGQGRPAVAEIGHLRPGLDCTTAAETVENLASGPGLVATAARLAQQSGVDLQALRQLQSACGDDWTRLTAQQLVELAAQGNTLAERAWHEGLRALGWAIAQVITLIAPEVVIVGGGVSLAGEVFFEPLREQMRRYVFTPLRDHARIEPAALGEWVVVHGAIALARGGG